MHLPNGRSAERVTREQASMLRHSKGGVPARRSLHGKHFKSVHGRAAFSMHFDSVLVDFSGQEPDQQRARDRRGGWAARLGKS